MRHIFSDRNIATLYLVLFSIQFIGIEGVDISPIKVGAMALAPLILILKAPYFSKAILWGGVYYLTVVFVTLLQHDTFRSSTIIYMGMWLVMFMMFYNILYKDAFTVDYFIRLVKFMIMGYVIFVILQQIAFALGLPKIGIINFSDLNLLKGFRGLAVEESHGSRILFAFYYAYLKMREIQNGGIKPSFKELFAGGNKWLTIGFLYAMMTMGSGTAYICLGILCLYFIRRKYLLFIIPGAVALYFTVQNIEYVPIKRAVKTIEATMTMDVDKIIRADGSAAYRVVPIVNTIKNIDLTKSETWFGQGVDTMRDSRVFSDKWTVGGISDYGLLCYILSLIFLFKCCIRRIWSIETLSFFVLLEAGITSQYFIWSVLMIFAVIKYFYTKQKENRFCVAVQLQERTPSLDAAL